jgi:DNA-binding transcriptional LysR family regulator
MALNLHHLRVFAVVGQLGGIGVAARAIGVSQPAISRSIRDLEAELGLKILERGPNGVVLTAAGRELYEHAQAVVAAERAAEEAMSAVRGLARGTLHVGASTTIATYILPPLIGAFTRAHPGIELRLSAVHTRMLVPLVRQHQVDVALAEAPVADRRVVVRRWITDEMAVIAAPSHPLAQRAHSGQPIPPSALDEELLILREPESGTRDLVLRGLSAANIAPSRTMAVDGTEVIKQLVAEGVGIAVVSRDAVADQVSVGRLVTLRVDGLSIVRPFNRLTVLRRRPSAAARAFLTLLAEEAQRRATA